jgi:hypothetical protein
MSKTTKSKKPSGWKKNVKSKLELHYNEKDRLEYLTGFQKRNQLKKQQRQVYKKQQLKSQQKELKQQKRDSLKEHRLKALQDLERIEAQQQSSGSKVVDETQQTNQNQKVTVTITQI